MTGIAVGLFAFNQAAYLPTSIASLRDAGAPDVEIHLVDDGSTDGSAGILVEAASRLEAASTIWDGSNRGLPTRMQEVIDATSAEWLLWLAADDALVPGAIQRLHAAASPDVDVVFGNLEVMRADGTHLGYARPRDTWQGATARRYAEPRPPLDDLLRVNNFVPGGMTLIRRSAIVAAGGYPPGIRPEDLSMWLTIGGRSRFRYIAHTVGRYRVVPGSGSRDEPLAMRNQAAMCRHHLGFGHVPRRGLARLMAMRWALHVSRCAGRPVFGLGAFADLAGLSRREVARELPLAGSAPVIGSVTSWTRHRLRRTWTEGEGAVAG